MHNSLLAPQHIYGLLLSMLFVAVASQSSYADVVWENEFSDEDPITNLMTVNADSTTMTFMTRVISDRDSGGLDISAVRSATFFSFESGTTGNHAGYLEMTFDNIGDDPQDYIEMTINFSNPVTNLQFSVLDVDGSPTASWDDGVEVFYNGINTKPIASYRSLGGSVFLDNEADLEGYEGGGASTPGTSTASNVDFDFGGEEVSSLRFRYLSTDDAVANPASQFIGISDFTYTSTVPEPNALCLLGLIGCLVATRRRSR